MTIFSKNWGVMAPLAPPGYGYECSAGCLGPLTWLGRYTAHCIFWLAKLFHKLK